MISSVRSSSTRLHRRDERIGVRDLAVHVEPLGAEDRERRAKPALRLGMLAARGIALRADDEEARRALRGARADPVEERLAEHGLVGDDEDVGARAAADVGDDVLDRTIAGRLADLVDEVLAEPPGARLRVRADDDLVDLLGREDVLHGRERLVVEHGAVRRDAREPKRREHAVEPAAGCRAPRVAVDDVALAWLASRARRRRPGSGPARRGGAASRRARPRRASRSRRRGPTSLSVMRALPRCRLLRRAEDRVLRAGDAVLVRPADDLRDLVEVEDRRRGRDLPLERARVPGVRLGDRAAHPARDHVVDEEHERRPEHEGRDRDEEVEVAERLVVVGDAPRHPAQADVVHREERRVEADERQPEVPLPERLGVHPPGHLREPVVDARVDREHGAAEEHVVDVRDDEVRVRGGDVDRDRAEVDPRETADHEHRHEPEREEHRRRQVDAPAPQASRSTRRP